MMETATEHVMESAPAAPASEVRQRIAVALGAAILAAGVILVLFILPALFIVIMGPALVQIVTEFGKIGQ